MKKALLVIVSLVILFTCAQVMITLGKSKQPESPYANLGGDFQLNGVNGEISLKKFEGEFLVMYIGFTHCPDICPTSMETMEKAFKLLPVNLRKKTQAFFVSVDYKRDTGKSVDEYIKYYISDGVGATGTKEQIDKLVKKYAAYYQINKDKDSYSEFSIDHTSRFYLISSKGKLLDSIPDSKGSEYLSSQIQDLYE